jgi:hypothetical protein
MQVQAKNSLKIICQSLYVYGRIVYLFDDTKF